MKYKEFKKLLQNDIVPIVDKSYYTNNMWKTSRCRIDVCFWPELLYYVIAGISSRSNINEYYLAKTREISNKAREYKISNNMDISAICKWLNLRKKHEPALINTVSSEKIMIWINQFIDEKIMSRNHGDKFTEAWTELKKQDSLVLSNNNDVWVLEKNTIPKTRENIRWNVIPEEDFMPSLKTRNKSINHSHSPPIILDTDLEKIGLRGERIIFEYLKSKYKNYEVRWASKEEKYLCYDFEIKKGNSIIYVEAKSTKATTMNRFFLSKNEFDFYLCHKNNYRLILVSNVFEQREGCSPFIWDYENFEIVVKDPLINQSNLEKISGRWIFSMDINQLLWNR